MENYYRDITENQEQPPSYEDEAVQMYFDEKSGEEKSVYFSLTVFQTALCIILTVFIFLMAFFASFKEKITEATDYFQSFELTGDDIKNEMEAMRDFLSDAEI